MSEPKFEFGEAIAFNIPNYGTGRGYIVAHYMCPDNATNLYAIYPKNPRMNDTYKYVCVITEEKNIVSAPF